MSTGTSSSAVKPRLLQPPSRDLAAKDTILFYHPHHQGPGGLLLSLARVDEDLVQDAPVAGVHHGTALTACQIIAGNLFHTGYLSLDQAGQQRVNTPLDGVLREDKYFFIVEGDENYAIVPSFRDWIFPHDGLPDAWATNPGELPGSLQCSITGASYAVDGAHIIPREENRWYNQNAMFRYSSDINNLTNILPLRKELHKCFDDGWFVIVPKESGNTRRYVTHILPQSAAELWPTYQNIIVQGLSHDSNAFLFARFAWAILQQVKPFITMGARRKVLQLEYNENNASISHKATTLPGPELQNLYGGGGSKSATPMKRKFSALEDIEGFALENSSGDSDSDLDAQEFRDGRIGMSGRDMDSKRRGQSSSETLPEVLEELKASVRDLITSQDTVEE